MLRENLLRDLARRTATDPAFPARLRAEGTLTHQGHDLTGEELRLVEDLRRRTAPMSDEDLARLLAGGRQTAQGRTRQRRELNTEARSRPPREAGLPWRARDTTPL